MCKKAELTYFILTRKIFDSAIWRDDPHILKLFIFLIGTARHNKIPKKYTGFEIKRGELVTSLSQIAEDNEYMKNGKLQKWSRQKVSRMLKVLKDQGYIKILSDTYGTHVSVENYNTYQDSDTYRADKTVTGLEQDCYGSVTGLDINNNVNNVKKDKKDKNKEKTDRKKDFADRLASFKETYSRELLKAFYDYWTESGENDKKMRFEKQKSYDIKRRLATWKNRENKFNNNQPERKTNNRDLTSQYGHYNKTDKYEHEKIEGFKPISPEDMAKIDNFPDL